ncbi:MAG: Gfo/Idh/MocA family oxidoreductase [Flavobacteriaceae bacterium]|nr:Gfo/Idh/MocA family oxidoreductase [Flavobacteriaceae bacterium]
MYTAQKPLGWGIIGLGKIAHSFVRDLALVPEARLVAVGSRSREKADAFAQQYAEDGQTPVTACDSYEALLALEEVSVVYIATPHTSHVEWSLKALAAGKHVLCEKPMAMTPEEVKQVTGLAREKGLFFMEALWSRFNPAVQKAIDYAQEGHLGKLSYVQADFGFFALDRDPDSRLLNPELGGGSLWDIGIYPIFWAYQLLGMPTSMVVAQTLARTGVDAQLRIDFLYPEATAQLLSSFATFSAMTAQVGGTSGSVLLHPRWHETDRLTLQTPERGIETEVFQLDGKGYTYEIREVIQCISQGRLESLLWSHQNSWELNSLLADVAESANSSGT